MRPIISENQGFGFFREAFYSALVELTGDPDAEGTIAQRAAATMAARVAFDRMARKLIAGQYVSTPLKARRFLDARGGRFLAEQIGHRGNDLALVPWLSQEIGREFGKIRVG